MRLLSKLLLALAVTVALSSTARAQAFKDLLVAVPGPLLEVAVRRDADQRHGELPAAELVGQPAELPGDVAVGVAVLGLV